MDELTKLTFARKHYNELLKLFFYEIQAGKQLDELTELQRQIDLTRLEVQRLEAELDIQKD